MLYSVYQDTKKGGTNKFYGRATHPNTLNLDDIADRIQRNCSMKKSDVYAVLIEMVEVIKDEISNSNKVCLDGFGYFYNTIKTIGSVTEDEFTANDNIVNIRTRFLPCATVNTATGTRTRTTISDNITFKKVVGFRQ